MKNVRKFFATLAAMLMIMGTCITTFAAEKEMITACENVPDIYGFCTTESAFVRDNLTYALRHHSSDMYSALFALKPAKANSILEIPRLILYETEDGGFIVHTVDKNGKLLNTSKMYGTSLEIMNQIYQQIFKQNI